MSSPTHDFELDRFQLDAIEHLDAGRSVLVAAPTGSGKTVIAEHAIDLALSQRRRAFYTAPIKALSNQKYRDLAARVGSNRVGLLTGDNAINPDADIVVMTTEVLRNMLYEGRQLDDLDFVVLDEVHYLEDSFRGPVWEEVILHLPPHVRLVALSATVSNTDELTGVDTRGDRVCRRAQTAGCPRAFVHGRRQAWASPPRAPNARRRRTQPRRASIRP
ncbi:MAG: DEAD/DEAH box helicase [Acidimicrobiales bacterium]